MDVINFPTVCFPSLADFCFLKLLPLFKTVSNWSIHFILFVPFFVFLPFLSSLKVWWQRRREERESGVNQSRDRMGEASHSLPLLPLYHSLHAHSHTSHLLNSACASAHLSFSQNGKKRKKIYQHGEIFGFLSLQIWVHYLQFSQICHSVSELVHNIHVRKFSLCFFAFCFTIRFNFIWPLFLAMLSLFSCSTSVP